MPATPLGARLSNRIQQLRESRASAVKRKTRESPDGSVPPETGPPTPQQSFPSKGTYKVSIHVKECIFRSSVPGAAPAQSADGVVLGSSAPDNSPTASTAGPGGAERAAGRTTYALSVEKKENSSKVLGQTQWIPATADGSVSFNEQLKDFTITLHRDSTYAADFVVNPKWYVFKLLSRSELGSATGFPKRVRYKQETVAAVERDMGSLVNDKVTSHDDTLEFSGSHFATCAISLDISAATNLLFRSGTTPPVSRTVTPSVDQHRDNDETSEAEVARQNSAQALDDPEYENPAAGADVQVDADADADTEVAASSAIAIGAKNVLPRPPEATGSSADDSTAESSSVGSFNLSEDDFSDDDADSSEMFHIEGDGKGVPPSPLRAAMAEIAPPAHGDGEHDGVTEDIPSGIAPTLTGRQPPDEDDKDSREATADAQEVLCDLEVDSHRPPPGSKVGANGPTVPETNVNDADDRAHMDLSPRPGAVAESPSADGESREALVQDTSSSGPDGEASLHGPEEAEVSSMPQPLSVAQQEAPEEESEHTPKAAITSKAEEVVSGDLGSIELDLGSIGDLSLLDADDNQEELHDAELDNEKLASPPPSMEPTPRKDDSTRASTAWLDPATAVESGGSGMVSLPHAAADEAGPDGLTPDADEPRGSDGAQAAGDERPPSCDEDDAGMSTGAVAAIGASVGAAVGGLATYMWTRKKAEPEDEPHSDAVPEGQVADEDPMAADPSVVPSEDTLSAGAAAGIGAGLGVAAGGGAAYALARHTNDERGQAEREVDPDRFVPAEDGTLDTAKHADAAPTDAAEHESAGVALAAAADNTQNNDTPGPGQAEREAAGYAVDQVSNEAQSETSSDLEHALLAQSDKGGVSRALSEPQTGGVDTSVTGPDQEAAGAMAEGSSDKTSGQGHLRVSTFSTEADTPQEFQPDPDPMHVPLPVLTAEHMSSGDLASESEGVHVLGLVEIGSPARATSPDGASPPEIDPEPFAPPTPDAPDEKHIQLVQRLDEVLSTLQGLKATRAAAGSDEVDEGETTACSPVVTKDDLDPPAAANLVAPEPDSRVEELALAAAVAQERARVAEESFREAISAAVVRKTEAFERVERMSPREEELDSADVALLIARVEAMEEKSWLYELQNMKNQQLVQELDTRLRRQTEEASAKNREQQNELAERLLLTDSLQQELLATKERLSDATASAVQAQQDAEKVKDALASVLSGNGAMMPVRAPIHGMLAGQSGLLAGFDTPAKDPSEPEASWMKQHCSHLRFQLRASEISNLLLEERLGKANSRARELEQQLADHGRELQGLARTDPEGESRTKAGARFVLQDATARVYDSQGEVARLVGRLAANLSVLAQIGSEHMRQADIDSGWGEMVHQMTTNMNALVAQAAACNAAVTHLELAAVQSERAAAPTPPQEELEPGSAPLVEEKVDRGVQATAASGLAPETLLGGDVAAPETLPRTTGQKVVVVAVPDEGGSLGAGIAAASAGGVALAAGMSRHTKDDVPRAEKEEKPQQQATVGRHDEELSLSCPEEVAESMAKSSDGVQRVRPATADSSTRAAENVVKAPDADNRPAPGDLTKEIQAAQPATTETSESSSTVALDANLQGQAHNTMEITAGANGEGVVGTPATGAHLVTPAEEHTELDGPGTPTAPGDPDNAERDTVLLDHPLADDPTALGVPIAPREGGFGEVTEMADASDLPGVTASSVASASLAVDITGAESSPHSPQLREAVVLPDPAGSPTPVKNSPSDQPVNGNIAAASTIEQEASSGDSVGPGLVTITSGPTLARDGEDEREDTAEGLNAGVQEDAGPGSASEAVRPGRSTLWPLCHPHLVSPEGPPALAEGMEVLVTQPIDVSLEDFFKAFLETADFAYRVAESCGDEEVEVSDWQEIQGQAGLVRTMCCERTIFDGRRIAIDEEQTCVLHR